MSIESRSRQYGNVFGQWQIKHLLGTGSGGKSAVFQLKRKGSDWDEYCALKVISLIEEQGSFDEFSPSRQNEYKVALEACKQAAITEVRLMAQLRGNTNIVDYLDYQFEEWSDETDFGCDLLIRMEFLSGLRADLRKGRLFDAGEIVQIGKDIATALVLCHSKNILHRDIKPENIFYNANGNFKLGDFGISRILDAAPDASASTGIGTPEYAAPEQDKGDYKFLVDIYSLGIVLYELANQNRLPFAASVYAHPADISKRMAGTPLPVPTDASPELAAVILKACAFNPKDRYQTAQELLDALSKINTDSGVLSVQTPFDETPSERPHVPPVDDNSEKGPYSTITAAKGSTDAGDYVTVPASSPKEMESNGYETVPASSSSLEHVEGYFANDLKQFQKCQEAAAKGDAEAQFELAGYYEKGFCTLKSDPVEAFKWYKKAAKQGHLDAQVMVAACYRNGRGVEADEEQYSSWILKAAKNGSAQAQYEVGCQEKPGKTQKERWLWLKKAADQHYILAILQLAWDYSRLDQPAYDQVVFWYEKAVALGDTYAMISLAELYFEGKKITRDYNKAYDLFKLTAESSEEAHEIGEACWHIGECYYYGLGKKQDDVEAFNWFAKAAEKEYLSGKLSLAHCYYYGRGVSIDYQKAFSVYESIGDINSTKEMMAECYYFGRGVERNVDKAVDLCLSIDEVSYYDHAQLVLGLCYLNGTGISQNAAKGFMILEECGINSEIPQKRERKFDSSTSSNDTPFDKEICAVGEYQLGLCFYRGNGTSQNYDKAKQYLERSSNSGNVQAMVLLAKCLKDGFGYYDFSPLHKASLLGESLAIDLINAWIAECQQGEKPADQYALASYHQITGDLSSAADYFELAAAQDHTASQYQLGLIYMNGTGRPIDLSIAATWLKRASNRGDTQAETQLDECLKKMSLFQKMKWKSANRSK